jgi:hypothetical protein
MVELLVRVVDLTSGWAYASLAGALALMLLWRLMLREFGSARDRVGRAIILAIFLIVSALDKAVFMAAVKAQPSADFGFWAAVVLALALTYLCLALFVYFAARALAAPQLTVDWANAALPALFSLSGAEIGYGLGHSSLGGVILAVARFYVLRAQEAATPDPPAARRPARRKRE